MTVPEARLSDLRARLQRGVPLELAAVAEEFGVSVDTVRRDLKQLEAQGMARCVRGGAMPVQRPLVPALERSTNINAQQVALAAAVLPLIEDGMVLMLDGGTTVLTLAQMLPVLPNSLIVTPAPAVALAGLAAGIETQLIGGRLSAFGAISVGHDAVDSLSRVAADLAVLGVCGMEAGFGYSADNLDEAHVKQAMLAASHRSIALTTATKLGRRARHRVSSCDRLDMLITDGDAQTTGPLAETGLEIHHV